MYEWTFFWLMMKYYKHCFQQWVPEHDMVIRGCHTVPVYLLSIFVSPKLKVFASVSDICDNNRARERVRVVK